MILITTYYKSNNENRNSEIDKCLLKNSENNYIEKIYLLNNQTYNLDFINNNKIVQIIINTGKDYKLKYNDAIKFINENLSNNICILSNSDIYFDDTLSKITDSVINNKLFALLRYDEDINGNKKIFEWYNMARNDTQDSWIFKSPLKVDLDKLNFSLGTLGCDSIFASILYDTGITITNPSYDIVTTHVHLSEHRSYNVDDRIHGKYCLVKPCNLYQNSVISLMDY